MKIIKKKIKTQEKKKREAAFTPNLKGKSKLTLNIITIIHVLFFFLDWINTCFYSRFIDKKNKFWVLLKRKTSELI
jgi:hypothetical protein